MAERLTHVIRMREVWSPNARLAKFKTALQTVRHRFNIYTSSCVALALWRGDGYRILVARFGVIQWV